MTAAKKLRIAPNPDDTKERLPDRQLELRGDGRAIAVAKFRELADKLERGELDGARVQWRAQNAEEEKLGKPTEMTTVAVTPRTDEGWENGTVELMTYKIEEV
jgi:hypothetical protein